MGKKETLAYVRQCKLLEKSIKKRRAGEGKNIIAFRIKRRQRRGSGRGKKRGEAL